MNFRQLFESKTPITDYDTWRDKVDAQGGEIHPQRDRNRMVAQSWSGETIGEFHMGTNQGWITPGQPMNEFDVDEGLKGKIAGAALAAANLLSPAQAAEEPVKPITIAYVQIDGEVRKYNLGDKFSNAKEAEQFISGVLDKQGISGYTLDIKHGYPKQKTDEAGQGVAEGAEDLDRQALDIADKLITDKNLAKLNDMAHDSTIYRALERYFAKNNISTTIFNRVAAIVFKKLDKYGRRLSTDPRIQEQGVAEDTTPNDEKAIELFAQIVADDTGYDVERINYYTYDEGLRTPSGIPVYYYSFDGDVRYVGALPGGKPTAIVNQDGEVGSRGSYLELSIGGQVEYVIKGKTLFSAADQQKIANAKPGDDEYSLVMIALDLMWGRMQHKFMEQGVAEGKADPTGSWVVYDGSKVKRFKSREGAKAYAEKNGGKVASSEFYADKIQKQGVKETTGDPKFDKMLKGITGKRQVAKQQKADTKQQARDAFGGMFGGGNPADSLGIRKKNVDEGKGDFAQAIENLHGWHEKESNNPDIRIWEFDDREGGYYAQGTVMYNTSTGRVKVKFEDKDGYHGGDVNDTFNSIGDAMNVLKNITVQIRPNTGKAQDFDKLGGRTVAGPDDLYKTDRAGKKGTLNKSRMDTMKASSPYRKTGPKGQLPEQGVAEGDDGYGYKSLSTEQIMKLIQSGNWEAVQDVVPGKHIQLRNNRNGKNTTVHVKQDVAEGFDELDAYIKAKQAPKPSGGAGIKRGSYGMPGRKITKGMQGARLGGGGTGHTTPGNRDFGRPHSIPRATPRGIDDYDANYRREVDEGEYKDTVDKSKIPAVQRKAQGGDWKVSTQDLEHERSKSPTGAAGLAKAKQRLDMNENLRQLPPEVIDLLKKVAQSDAAPEHKKAIINSIMAKYQPVKDIAETPTRTAREKFNQGLKRAGFDPEAAAKRLTDLIAKQKAERDQFEKANPAVYGDDKEVKEEKVRLDPKCWTGKKIGNPKTKVKGGVRVNNCVPK